MNRRQFLTGSAAVGGMTFLPIRLPRAQGQSMPVDVHIKEMRVLHVKHLISDLVQRDEFFHQPHGEDLAAQMYRGFFNQAEPKAAKVKQIVRGFNRVGPERVAWSMVTSEKFYRIRRPVDWHLRLHGERPHRWHQNAAYLNSRMERLYEGLYGRRPTAFELTDDLEGLSVPVRSSQLPRMLVRSDQRWSIRNTAYADEAMSIDVNGVLSEAVVTQIAAAATLAEVAGIMAGLGVTLISTVPMTGITVGVVGGFITLTALVPFSLAIYLTYLAFTINSQPTGQPGEFGNPGGEQPAPPPSDQPSISDPTPPGPPPGASMDVSISIGGDIGDPGSIGGGVGSDPGDPGDGSADGGGGAGTGDAGAGDGTGDGGVGDGGW